MCYSKLRQFVYIITDGCYIKINDEFKIRYKIGKTNNPFERFEDLKAEQCCCSSSFEIVYLLDIEDMTEFETFLHRKYKNIRIDEKKEWFYLDIEEFNNFITKYCEDNPINRIISKEEIEENYIEKDKLKKKENLNKLVKIGINPDEKDSGQTVYKRVKHIQEILLKKPMNVKQLIDEKIEFTAFKKSKQYIEIYKWTDLKYDIEKGGYFKLF